ncbi:hypothetical protein XAR_2584 [Xanthomonas citri pv. glycines str. 8ra]|nr:hypothetical protein XAR_2584 [Xanthomonas citri pv. glycines str. 8ra]
MHDRLAHHCAKPRHPLTQPTRDATSMQGKIRTATTPAHCCRLFFMRSGLRRHVATAGTPAR